MSEGFFSRAFHMYVDGFRSMTVGRRLWAIIIIKLVILFAIFRLFFFPDILNDRRTMTTTATVRPPCAMHCRSLLPQAIRPKTINHTE